MRPLFPLLSIGFLLLEALFLLMVRLQDLRQHAAAFLVLFGAVFAVYLGLVWLVRRTAVSRPWLLWGIVLGGVVFRLTLVGLTPTLSNDISRYLWDGRVQQAGVNPYRFAPDDPALAHLRTDDWQWINHKDIPTIYPPVMQLAFRMGVALAPTLLMQKLVFLLFDLAVVMFLVWQLPRWGVSPLMSLVYAWHPLVVVEVAGSGHNDPLGVWWMLVGLALWSSRRRLIGTAAFALAFLSKLTTALLWPFYWVRARRLLLVFLAAIALAGLWCWCSPYVTPGFRHYAGRWEFNSSVYALLQSALGVPLLARLVCGLLVLAAGVFMARKTDDPTRYTVVMIQAAILAAPVLEPWYLLWLIPLLCLRFSWMWLGFSGLVMLSYTVLIRYVSDGIWRIPAWVPWVEYGPLYAWLLWRAGRRGQTP
ncbi:MAG: hypothetical protein HYY91_04705 [Candidatus Omnitrophica bacterium]|nr:hypothetical protein [Candidatus Omnitrophota bacterium]